MKPKNYTKTEIQEATIMGLEFEFFSKLKDIEISRALGKLLGKRVVIPYQVPALGETPKPLYHSPVEVTADIFKLEPDFSGGKGMYELVTGPTNLKEAKVIAKKVLDWIDQYGYTTERCSIHANISFNYDMIEPLYKVENLNVLKFILAFDEGFIYKNFPVREKSVYARSINNIVPNSFFFYDSVPSDWSIESMVNVPNQKYFGINFTKREKGYLEFRYMGGADYEKKPQKVFETIDHCVNGFFNVLNNNDLSKVEKSKLKKLFKKHHAIVDSFSSLDKFIETHKNIQITVDLGNDKQVIKTYWERIKLKLFDLIVNSGLKKGRFNLDTEFGDVQLADAKLSNAVIDGMDLVECEIDGVITDCVLYFCKIENSRLKNCEAMKDNEFKNSKLQEIALHSTNKCDNCFIENNGLPINCKVVGGVIRKGEIGVMAEVDENCSIVESKSKDETMEAPNKKKEEIKDWRWIKGLSKNNKKK